MNHFFKYKQNNFWITVREEYGKYYVVLPRDLSIIILTKVQAYILYKLNIEGYTESQIKNQFLSNNLALQNAVSAFLKNARQMDLA